MEKPKIAKIWLPEPRKTNSHTSFKTILLTLFLAIAVMLLGSVAILALHFSGFLDRFLANYTNAVLTFLFLLLYALMIYIVFVGIRKMTRYGDVFILLEDQRLFYLNLKQYAMQNHSGYGRIGGLKGFYAMDQLMNQIRQTGKLPAIPMQILQVSRIKKTGPQTFYVCWAIDTDEKPKRISFAVSDKLEDADSLNAYLGQLRNSLFFESNKPSKKLHYAIAFLLVMIVSVIFCYLSHWNVLILPNIVYYPSMIVAVVSGYISFCFYWYYRRGY